MTASDFKDSFREVFLQEGMGKRVVFHPFYPEREMWMKIVEAFEAIEEDIRVVAFEDVQWGDEYKQAYNKNYVEPQRINPEDIAQVAYELNECHIVTEDLGFCVSFTHDREIILRGDRDLVNQALNFVDELEEAHRYLKRPSDRDMDLEKDIRHKGVPVEDIVERKAEEEKEWGGVKLERPEKVEDYFKQLDKLMRALMEEDEVYYVQTHPKTSFKIAPEHVKHSHLTQRYIFSSSMEWGIRMYYDRKIALKGREDALNQLLEKHDLVKYSG